MNDRQLTFSNEQAYDLVIAIAIGKLDDVPTICEPPGATSRPAPALGSAAPSRAGQTVTSTRR